MITIAKSTFPDASQALHLNIHFIHLLENYIYFSMDKISSILEVGAEKSRLVIWYD
jgi:hypothetical protein